MEIFKKSGILVHEDDHKLELIRSMFGGKIKNSSLVLLRSLLKYNRSCKSL